MNKIKSKIIILVILFLLAIASIVFVLNDDLRGSVDNIIDNVIPKPQSKYDVEELEKMWKDNKKINKDYVGQIIFDSGLINLPFVQGYTNSTYITTDWITGQYNIEGSVFMDYLCEKDDQNITIYGHYVYSQYDPEGTHMFTPLAKLIDKENYNENKHVILVLEDGIREFDVAAVYYCQLSANDQGEYVYADNDLQYYWRNIDGDIEFNYDNLNINEDYFNNYKSTIQNKQFYPTGVSYSKKDKFLTLQTCVENRDDLREIVLLKEVKNYKYEDVKTSETN